MDTMYVKASKTDTKDTEAHNKYEICESDFVKEAITHIIQSHIWIMCMYACAETHSKRTKYQTKSQQNHTYSL